MIASSTDKTLWIWRLDKARELLMFPWIVPMQIIKDFPSIHTLNANDKPVWITALDYDSSEKFKLFAGDSDGSMLIFKVAEG